MRYFMQSNRQTGSAINYGNNLSAGHSVNVGDVDLYYETYGEGEPFIILHGGGVGCAYEMGVFIDKLSQKFRVIIPSSRGHGRSGFGSAPYSYERKALDIFAVMQAEGIRKAPILGFSDGAYTAYKMAISSPSMVSYLIAIGAGESIPGLHRVVVDYDELFALDPEYFEQQKKIMPEPDRWPSWMSMYGDFWNHELISKNVFMNIQCPTLFMAGEKDGNAPLDTVISAYKMTPNATLSIIADAPHPCFIDYFTSVWDQVSRFVEKNRQS